MGAKVSFVERRFSLDLDGFSPQERSAMLAAFAKEQLAETISAGEAPPTYERFVDGVKDAPEERVRPDHGVIHYEFQLFTEIAAAALEYLRANSPVRSGAYREAHFLLVDGQRVDDPASIPADAAELIVTNNRPYARKVEVGAMQMSVPSHLYDHAQSALASLYRQVMKIDLQFIELEGGYVLRGSHGRKGRQAGDPLTYPALIITRL